MITAAIFAVGFGLTGFLAQGRFTATKITVLWAAAAVFTPLALLVALYARIAHLDRSIPFAILAVLLAAPRPNIWRVAKTGRGSPPPSRSSQPARWQRSRWRSPSPWKKAG